MSQIAPVNARLTKARTSITVSAAAGGAGQAIADTSTSLYIAVLNTGIDDCEYKIGAGSWLLLQANSTANLDIDLSTTTVYIRKVLHGRDVSVVLDVTTLVDGYVIGDDVDPALTEAVVNGGFNLFLPAIVDVTRNSTNSATDDDEVVLGTLVVPPNVLRIGSVVELWALFENTSSAAAKQFFVRVNGTGSTSPANNTTALSSGIRIPFHIFDANTLAVLNNASAGTGTAGTGIIAQTINNIVAVGFTITLGCRWPSGAVAGEYIRLKMAKINLMI